MLYLTRALASCSLVLVASSLAQGQTCTPTNTIADVQGASAGVRSHQSPLVGQVVAVEGIVTGRASNGFYIQMPTGDGNAQTSDGVLVFTSSAPPAAAAVGNSVCVKGIVAEFVPAADPGQAPLTEITRQSAANPLIVELRATGQPVPAPLVVTALNENHEGMRVRVNSLTVVGPTIGSLNAPTATVTSTGVFHGVSTGTARPFREPGVHLEDPPATPTPPATAATVVHWDGNTERIRVDSKGLGLAAIDVNQGATVTNLTGPVTYAFRTYTILPEVAPTVAGGAAVIAAATPLATEWTVANLNVNGFYDDTDNPSIPVSFEPVLTPAAYQRRLTKLATFVCTMVHSPDILALQEVEDLTVLQRIATEITTTCGTVYSSWLQTGNTQAMNLGFLAKGTVTGVSVTQHGLTDTYIEPGGATALKNDRPPLVLRGTVGTVPVTVINVHQRSLIGIYSPTDGPRVREKRAQQVEFVADLARTLQSANPSDVLLIAGDFNAFAFNDGYVDVIGTAKGSPAAADKVHRLTAGGPGGAPNLTDSLSLLPVTQRYSYVFDGNAQTLDQILINSVGAGRLNRASRARANADFAATAYNTTGVARVSDHDVAIIYLNK